MAEDLTKEQRMERGRIAKGYQSDPLIKEAQIKARDELVKDWLDADEFDEKKARIVWSIAKAIEVVDDELRRIIADGQFAAAPPR